MKLSFLPFLILVAMVAGVRERELYCQSEINSDPLEQHRVSKAIIPVDKKATVETIALFQSLLQITSEKKYLVGHQDALAYGVNWKYEPGRSDVKDLTGDQPALYGWEIGHLELGDAFNIDSVPFHKMKDFIREGYERGAAITISWHGKNPATGKTSWDPEAGTVASILPGGDKHHLFKQQLDRVAAFLGDLKGNRAESIPVLFRPFHEHTEGWFWWGSRFTSAREYQQLFRFTVHYLKNVKGLHNLLYVYNTSSNIRTAVDYLDRYPGDDVVDVLSFDIYQDARIERRDSVFEKDMHRCLEIVEALAAERGKVAAVAEAGLNRISFSEWWTESIASTLRGRHVAYILFWRNAGLKHKEKEVEYFMPFKGHPAESNFKKFYALPETLFENDMAPYHIYQKAE